MLDRLIESKIDSSEKFRRTNFLLTIFFLVAMLLSGAMLYSLYAKPLGMTNTDLELSSIVAPVPAPPTEPPPVVETPKRELKVLSNTKAPSEIIRIVNQKSVDESPDIPKEFSTVKNRYASRPPGEFKIGKIDSAIASSNSLNPREGNGNNTGITAAPKSKLNEDTEEKEPPKMPKSVPPQPQPKVTKQTLGVINGIARDLPKPVYPAAATAIHAAGAVNVEVTIDEQGRVIAANAVSGHPLLRQAAEQAARRAVFSPTFLSRVPVKVTGVIVYNFIAPN